MILNEENARLREELERAKSQVEVSAEQGERRDERSAPPTPSSTPLPPSPSLIVGANGGEKSFCEGEAKAGAKRQQHATDHKHLTTLQLSLRSSPLRSSQQSQIVEAELKESKEATGNYILPGDLKEKKMDQAKLKKAVEMLSSRLQKAMEMIHELESEKKPPPSQQPNNFPGNPQGPASPSHSVMLVKTLSAQLTQQRQACKSALLQVEDVRRQGLAREEQLLKRIRDLEKIEKGREVREGTK